MSEQDPGAGPAALLRALARAQHALFALLLAVGLIQGWRTDASRPALVLVVIALAIWYAAGAARTRHAAAVEGPVEASRPGTGAPSRYAVIWLLVLAALWALAVLVSAELVWVAFALWLLAGHLLRTGWALALSLAILAAVVWSQVAETGWRTPGIIGPAVGMLFALGVSRGQALLARDAIERARLVRSLTRAQAETAHLQEQLLGVQREAGALTERTRLSRDIHDTLAQGFSSILLLARAATVLDDEPALRRQLARIEQTAGDNLAESRRVVAALAPKSLSDNGFTASLRHVLHDLTRDTGIAGELRLDADPPALTTTQEIALLRTVQGLLANVRAHSRATQVVVSVGAVGDQVRLDLVDDGVGFDPARVPQADPTRGGYGLAGSRARLAELGGGLDVESAPGSGTAVSAYLPLTRYAAPASTPERAQI